MCNFRKQKEEDEKKKQKKEGRSVWCSFRKGKWAATPQRIARMKAQLKKTPRHAPTPQFFQCHSAPSRLWPWAGLATASWCRARPAAGRGEGDDLSHECVCLSRQLAHFSNASGGPSSPPPPHPHSNPFPSIPTRTHSSSHGQTTDAAAPAGTAHSVPGHGRLPPQVRMSLPLSLSLCPSLLLPVARRCCCTHAPPAPPTHSLLRPILSPRLPWAPVLLPAAPCGGGAGCLLPCCSRKRLAPCTHPPPLPATLTHPPNRPSYVGKKARWGKDDTPGGKSMDTASLSDSSSWSSSEEEEEEEQEEESASEDDDDDG